MTRKLEVLQFAPAFVPRNAEADVEQCSVLRPIGGNKRQNFNNDAEVAGLFRTTLSLWRSRVVEWFKLGWRPHGGRPGKLLNCTPSCVATAETVSGLTKECRQFTVCPWCWARESVELFRSMRPCIPAPDGTADKYYDVFVSTGQSCVAVTPESTSMIEAVLDGISHDLRNALLAVRPAFSYRNVTLAPVRLRFKSPDGAVHASWHWEFVARILFAVPPGYVLPGSAELALGRIRDNYDMSPHFYRAASADRVKHAVIQARRYPDTLLKGDCANLAYTAVLARSRHRLAFRGGAARV